MFLRPGLRARVSNTGDGLFGRLEHLLGFLPVFPESMRLRPETQIAKSSSKFWNNMAG
jgi:hypothetical protein